MRGKDRGWAIEFARALISLWVAGEHELTERFLDDNPRVVRRVVNHCGRDEVALAVGGGRGGSRGDLELRLLNVLEELLDALELHLVLDGAEHRALLLSVADGQILDGGGNFGDKLVVNGLVDVDALDGDADL